MYISLIFFFKDGILRFEVNTLLDVQCELNFMRFPFEVYGFTAITKLYDYILVYSMNNTPTAFILFFCIHI